MSNKVLKISLKKAKNGTLIITAPNGDDYACKEDEEVSSAIREICDDESQYEVVQGEALRAEVVEEVPHEPRTESAESSDSDDDDFISGSLTDNLIAEGLSFILGKAQESSAKSKDSYSRFTKK
jgi:hypothetical protein